MKHTPAKTFISAVIMAVALAGASPAVLSHGGGAKHSAYEGMTEHGAGPMGMMSGMGHMGMMEHMHEHMGNMGHMASMMHGMGPMMGGMHGVDPMMGGMGGMGPMMGGMGPMMGGMHGVDPMMGGMGGMGPMMGGMGPMMGGMGMMGMLELSDEQRSELNGIGDELRRKHWDIMGRMMDERAVLRDLLQAEEHDPKTIGAAYGRLFDLRRQMIEAAIEAGNRRKALLTDEQREQIRQRHAEMRQRQMQGGASPEGQMMNPCGMMGPGAGGAMQQGPGGMMGPGRGGMTGQGHMMQGTQ